MGPCREGGWPNNDEYMSVSTGLLVNGWVIIKIILGSIWLRGGQPAMLQNGRMNRVMRVAFRASDAWHSHGQHGLSS